MRCPKSYITIFLVLFSFSCQQHTPPTTDKVEVPAGVPGSLAWRMCGTYSGLYSKGLITLAINYISGSTASGYNLHKGLRRNINGPVELKGGQLNFVLKEPGGNPYDGTFYLSLDTASLKITGKWIPVDSTKAHAGPLALSRKQGTEERGYDLWNSDLGTLFFTNDGTCRLEYYPSADSSNSQMITV